MKRFNVNKLISSIPSVEKPEEKVKLVLKILNALNYDFNHLKKISASSKTFNKKITSLNADIYSFLTSFESLLEDFYFNKIKLDSFNKITPHIAKSIFTLFKNSVYFEEIFRNNPKITKTVFDSLNEIKKSILSIRSRLISASALSNQILNDLEFKLNKASFSKVASEINSLNKLFSDFRKSLTSKKKLKFNELMFHASTVRKNISNLFKQISLSGKKVDFFEKEITLTVKRLAKLFKELNDVELIFQDFEIKNKKSFEWNNFLVLKQEFDLIEKMIMKQSNFAKEIINKLNKKMLKLELNALLKEVKNLKNNLIALKKTDEKNFLELNSIFFDLNSLKKEDSLTSLKNHLLDIKLRVVFLKKDISSKKK